MWRVCNDVPFEIDGRQAGKVMNGHEIALAARFVEALDASTSADLVDPAYLTEGRIFVRVEGEGPLAREAQRLNGQLDGLRLLGLPVRGRRRRELPAASAPAMFVKRRPDRHQDRRDPRPDRGELLHASRTLVAAGQGRTSSENSSVSVLDGACALQALDRAIAAAFVTVKPASGRRKHHAEGREPPAVHRWRPRRPGGQLVGRPTVAVRRRSASGPPAPPSLPIQAASAAGRTGRAERAVIPGSSSVTQDRTNPGRFRRPNCSGAETGLSVSSSWQDSSMSSQLCNTGPCLNSWPADRMGIQAAKRMKVRFVLARRLPEVQFPVRAITTMPHERRRVYYSGHVQGVGFRATCRWLARGFEVAGFVPTSPTAASSSSLRERPPRSTGYSMRFRTQMGEVIRGIQIHQEQPDQPALTGFSVRA